MKVGKSIKLIREHVGKSIEQLSKDTGLPIIHLLAIESNTITPQLDDIDCIFWYFHLPVVCLFLIAQYENPPHEKELTLSFVKDTLDNFFERMNKA